MAVSHASTVTVLGLNLTHVAALLVMKTATEHGQIGASVPQHAATMASPPELSNGMIGAAVQTELRLFPKCHAGGATILARSTALADGPAGRIAVRPAAEGSQSGSL